jgi:hypothetical protein
VIKSIITINAEATEDEVFPLVDCAYSGKYWQPIKAFKINPDEGKKLELSTKFDQIFLQKTCFQTLNLALNRIYKKEA